MTDSASGFAYALTCRSSCSPFLEWHSFVTFAEDWAAMYIPYCESSIACTLLLEMTHLTLATLITLRICRLPLCVYFMYRVLTSAELIFRSLMILARRARSSRPSPSRLMWLRSMRPAVGRSIP